MKHGGALAIAGVATLGVGAYAYAKKLFPWQKAAAPAVAGDAGGGGAAPATPFAMGDNGSSGPSTAVPAAAPVPGPSSLITALQAANASLGAERLNGTPGVPVPGAPVLVDPGSGGGGFHLTHKGSRTPPPTPPARSVTVRGLAGLASNPKMVTAAAAVKALNASGCKSPAAMRAVTAFQSAVGLPQDGKYGPQTANAIGQWWLGPPAAPPPCKWS